MWRPITVKVSPQKLGFGLRYKITLTRFVILMEHPGPQSRELVEGLQRYLYEPNAVIAQTHAVIAKIYVIINLKQRSDL